MPTYIKTGFWEKARKGYKEWLNLDSLVQSLIQPNYKIYRALLNQQDDENPVAIVLENTFGFDFEWNRTDVGQYSFYHPIFDINKTHYFINTSTTPEEAFASLYFLVDTPNNGINITTTNSEEWPPVQSDNKLYYTPVEIRVYN